MFCGLAIHRTLSARAMSEKTRRLHAAALRMLTAQVRLNALSRHGHPEKNCLDQTLLPFITVYVPAFVSLFAAFLFFELGESVKVLPCYESSTKLAIGFDVPHSAVRHLQSTHHHLLHGRLSTVCDARADLFCCCEFSFFCRREFFVTEAARK